MVSNSALPGIYNKKVYLQIYETPPLSKIYIPRNAVVGTI